MKKLLIVMCCLLMVFVLVSCKDEPETPVDTGETEPAVTEPAATEPEATEPEATQPAQTEPAASEPTETQPEATEPEATQPAVTEPAASEPAATEPTETQPEATEPEPTEPTESQPEQSEPVAEKVEADLTKYQIVYPATDTSTSKGAATTIYDALKGAGLTVNKTKKDSESTEALEILVGSVNRQEATDAMAKLKSSEEYAIVFTENKIVIVASLKINVPVAVSYFLENYVDLETGKVDAEVGEVYIGTVKLVELAASEGKSSYVVVRSISGKYDTMAYDFLKALRTRTKDSEIKYLDDMEARPTNAKLILIGDDLDPKKYPEVAQVKAEWGFFDYGMAMVGDVIVIFANTAEVCEQAVELAKNQVNRESEWVGGKLLMKFDDSLHRTDDRFLSDYPAVEGKELKEYFYNADDEMVYIYGKVNKAEYDAYVAKLSEAGFVPTTHTIGRNYFATCIHPEKGQVHVGFYPAATTGVGDMKLYVNKLQVVSAIPEDTYNPETDKVSETIFHVMSQDYSNRGDRIWDGNGLNYIVTLEDGRFVIFDGGYDGTADAENIYNYMKAVNPKGEDAPIVIAAWFISHSHGDHFGALDAFMRKYSAVVTIEYFVANTPTEEQFGESNPWIMSSLPRWVKVANAQLIKPHTGQVITLCGTDFEILLTHEEVRGGGNDSSTVVRIHENGYTILLSADASTGMCGKMVSLYGDALKSDVLQLNHHGQSGGTTPFYEKVNPSFALWTTSEDGFSGYVGVDAQGNPVVKTGRIDGGGNAEGSAPASNRWIRDNVGKENCFVADDVIERILMPEGKPLRILTDTGYAVTNNYPKQDGDGLLHTYEPEDPNAGVDLEVKVPPVTPEDPEDTTPDVEDSDSTGTETGGGDPVQPPVSDTDRPVDPDPEETEPDEPLVEVPEIRTYRDLMAMKPGGNYILMNDIDMSYSNGALRTWTPLGTESKPFSGTFDGNGFKITGFKIDASKTTYVGFFGYNTGIIKNVEFSDFEIKASHIATMTVGAIAGGNAGAISNAYAVNGTITVKLATEITNPPIASTPSIYVGGLVGQNFQSILNSYADCDIVVDAKTSETSASVESTISLYAGGLVGNNTRLIAGCFALADMDITMLTDRVAAEKVGILLGASTGTQANCYYVADGNVKITTSIHGYATTTQTTPTVAYGSPIARANLMDSAWITTNLWIIETNRWKVTTTDLPVLNRDYDASLVTDISTWAQLKALSGHLLSGNYRLTADIDCQGETWTPISYFFGTFDGNGYEISNLNIAVNGEYVGFIGFLAGTVKDLTVKDVALNGSITVASNVGTLAGYNVGTVSNCYVYNTTDGLISLEKTSGVTYIGGLVGYNKNTVVHSDVALDIRVNTVADDTYVGAMVGGNFGAIQNSAADCTVTVVGTDDKAYAGGMVGTNDGTIDSSYAEGTLSVTLTSSGLESYVYAGGLAGRSSGKITNCYSMVDVCGAASATGTTSNTIAKVFVGGLVGRSAKGAITKCYSAGKVSGITAGNWDIAYVGGLVGYEASGAIRTSFSVSDLYGESAGASLQIGAMVGYSDSGILEKGYYSEELKMEIVNSVLNPGDALNIKPNNLGEEKTANTFTEAKYLKGYMSFSDTYWAMIDDGNYPTLKDAGSSLK